MIRNVATALLCLIFLGAGYWLGGQSHRQLQVKVQEALDSSQSAEELLAQVMTVFVADLGLKLGQREYLFSNCQTSQGQTTNSTNPSPTESSSSPDLERPSGASGPARGSSPGATSDKPLAWHELEKSRSLVASEREADEFLKTVRLENLFDVIKGAIPIGSDGVNMLTGTFKGRLIFFDANQKPKDVTLIMSSTGQGSSQTGSYELIISNGDQKESHTKGEGGLKHFNGLGPGSAGVLIRFTPESYVQLYSSDRYNGLFGNYYTQEAADKFFPTGTMWLHR